uniref:LLM class flavin-dependent oxidoreductase n=2 Tax=Streptomyces TaxID=1883 RepID=A0AAU2GTZ8_9ACTN
MAYDLEHLVAFGQVVRDLSLDRLYMGQSMLIDTQQAFAYLVGRGIEVPVGTSVNLTALRHPLDAAVQARSLALLTGTGTVAGFSTGDPQFATALHGIPYESPRKAVAQYLTLVRRLLDGEPVGFQGRTLQLEEPLLQIPHPPVSLAAGVLRPRTAYTAGQAADVAITLFTPTDHLKQHIVPALDRGAATRNRARPGVTCIVPFALRTPGRDARKLAFSALEIHLGGGYHAGLLRSAGLNVDTTDAWAGAGVSVDGGAFLYGTPDDVATELERYGEAGATEIVLSCAGVLLHEGIEAALSDVRAIVDLMRSRSVQVR